MKIESNVRPDQLTNLFKHRFDATKVREPGEVQDAFNMLAKHAESVLNLLFSQFEESDGRMSDEIILNSIDSVSYQIDDMKTIINAYFSAIRNNDKGLCE